MHQNPLKILCAFHDTEPDWLGIPPEEALLGHHLTVVHSYREMKEAILDEKRGIPSFDLVLSDVGLPGGYNDEECGAPIYCPIMLQPYLNQMLVRGLGIFVPKHSESSFELSDGYSVVVARRDCWTPNDKRDWLKLFSLVVGACNQSDHFMERFPKEEHD